MKKNTFGKYNESDSSDSYETELDYDTGKPIIPIQSKTGQKYDEMIDWATKRRGFNFISILKQKRAFKVAKQNDLKISQLKERWKELEESDFYKKIGFDWVTVVYSFDKKK